MTRHHPSPARVPWLCPRFNLKGTSWNLEKIRPSCGMDECSLEFFYTQIKSSHCHRNWAEKSPEFHCQHWFRTEKTLRRCQTSSKRLRNSGNICHTTFWSPMIIQSTSTPSAMASVVKGRFCVTYTSCKHNKTKQNSQMRAFNACVDQFHQDIKLQEFELALLSYEVTEFFPQVYFQANDFYSRKEWLKRFSIQSPVSNNNYCQGYHSMLEKKIIGWWTCFRRLDSCIVWSHFNHER